jgi:hypothetical protein
MWARIVTLVLGVWLMSAPGILGFDKSISNNDHIIGPLIISFSVIAMCESTRNVRIFNLPLGAWLLFAPWILGYDSAIAFISDYAVGVLTLLFSLVPLNRKHTFGGGWPAIWLSDSVHAHEALK